MYILNASTIRLHIYCNPHQVCLLLLLKNYILYLLLLLIVAHRCLVWTMVRIRKIPENPFVLNWNDEMHDIFIDSLEKQHDLGKRSDTGFKAEAWVYCVAQVQSVYPGKEAIPVEKLKNKLDHV